MMKVSFFCLIFALLLVNICLSSKPENNVQITREDEYIVSVELPRGLQDLDLLVSLGINLDHPSGQKKSIQAYVDSEDLKKLDDNGFSYSPIEFATLKERAAHYFEPKKTHKSRSTSWDWTNHHDYESMVDLLHEVASRYPDIVNLFSIGKTSKGRDLWVVEISDNPGVNEPGEPEFKYVANMHGDEVVGRELVLRFIVELCETYHSEHVNGESLWSYNNIRRLVDDTSIFLMPSMNPDGYESYSRYNSHNRDLNRSFPDRINGDPIYWEEEVLSVMNWISSKNFVLSANFHGGEVVANYPYDGNKERRSGLYTPAPDDALFKYLALTYSMSHGSMYRNPYFSDGITNGADWYILYGGMQDWNYETVGCFELTLEVSMTKWPRSTSLPGYWNENKLSMIAYMQLVHTGIKGFVKTSNGYPLSANLTIQGIDHVIHTDRTNGDYYRILAPRSEPYTLIATISQTQKQSFEFYVTEENPLATHDFVF